MCRHIETLTTEDTHKAAARQEGSGSKRHTESDEPRKRTGSPTRRPSRSKTQSWKQDDGKETAYFVANAFIPTCHHPGDSYRCEESSGPRRYCLRQSVLFCLEQQRHCCLQTPLYSFSVSPGRPHFSFHQSCAGLPLFCKCLMSMHPFIPAPIASRLDQIHIPAFL